MIAKKIQTLRVNSAKKAAERCIRCFSEKDVLNREPVDAFVVILRTRGCYWALQSGCSMCGYINEAAQTQVSDERLIEQFSEALKNHRHEKIIKIFTSGSFLDPAEISESAQTEILELISGKAEKVIVESRPEFVADGALRKLGKLCNLEIALGLESSNPVVLEKSINKGFGVDDYVKAAETINALGLSVKTYLLIKPPFMTEKEAISDAVNSAKFACDYSKTISFNPVNIQKNTLVEYLWKRHEYRPPWLWSVAEVLRSTYETTAGKVQLVCAPTGGGNIRGAHNCGKCDSEILNAVRNFSLTQNPRVLDNLDCSCKERWLDLVELDGFQQSSYSLI